MLAEPPSLALSAAECQCRYTARVPIYEYRCTNGHQFDVMQRMSDEPLTACTECGAPVQKVLNAPAIHFKGSGFHNTDYGKKTGAAAGSSSDGESKPSEGSSSEKSPDSDSSSSGSGSSSDSKSGDSKAKATTAD